MTEEQKAGPEAAPAGQSEKKCPMKLDRAFIEKRLRELWDGKIPLAQCFWLYYFAVVLVLVVISSSVGGIIGGLIRLISLGWSAFMVMPVVKSADAYKGDRNWALAAKIAAVLIAIGTAAGFLNLLAA